MSLTLVLQTPLNLCEPVIAVSHIHQPVPERPDHLHPQKLTAKAQRISRSTGSISDKSLGKALFCTQFPDAVTQKGALVLAPSNTVPRGHLICMQPCEPVLQKASEEQEALSEEEGLTF